MVSICRDIFTVQLKFIICHAIEWPLILMSYHLNYWRLKYVPLLRNSCDSDWCFLDPSGESVTSLCNFLCGKNSWTCNAKVIGSTLTVIIMLYLNCDCDWCIIDPSLSSFCYSGSYKYSGSFNTKVTGSIPFVQYIQKVFSHVPYYEWCENTTNIAIVYDPLAPYLDVKK